MPKILFKDRVEQAHPETATTRSLNLTFYIFHKCPSPSHLFFPTKFGLSRLNLDHNVLEKIKMRCLNLTFCAQAVPVWRVIFSIKFGFNYFYKNSLSYSDFKMRCLNLTFCAQAVPFWRFIFSVKFGFNHFYKNSLSHFDFYLSHRSLLNLTFYFYFSHNSGLAGSTRCFFHQIYDELMQFQLLFKIGLSRLNPSFFSKIRD